MITVNKIEYFTKSTNNDSFVNPYVCEKPWMRIYTSKGELEIPLSADYDEKFYSDKLQELAKLSSGSRLNMSYDFRDEK